MRRSTESKRAVPPFPLPSNTLGALLEATVGRNRNRVAMKHWRGDGCETILYGEFGSLVSRLGTGFIARGLAAGDRVALLSENSPAWGLV